VIPSAWYNLTPAEYAEKLRYRAERSEETARRKREEKETCWQQDETFFKRQARRLRAMALICDHSAETRVGLVDFWGLNNPSRSLEEECAAIERAEAL
jgi:hypothetical protein